MTKGKKFTAAEKYFKKIIDSKNKMIKTLNKSKDELLNENSQLIKQNKELKLKLERATVTIIELNKLTNLSSEDITALVDKAYSINKAVEFIDLAGNIGMY